MERKPCHVYGGVASLSLREWIYDVEAREKNFRSDLDPWRSRAGSVPPSTKVTQTGRHVETPGGRTLPPGSASPGRRHSGSAPGNGAPCRRRDAGTAGLGKPSLLTSRICVALGHCVLLKYVCLHTHTYLSLIHI